MKVEEKNSTSTYLVNADLLKWQSIIPYSFGFWDASLRYPDAPLLRNVLCIYLIKGNLSIIQPNGNAVPILQIHDGFSVEFKKFDSYSILSETEHL